MTQVLMAACYDLVACVVGKNTRLTKSLMMLGHGIQFQNAFKMRSNSPLECTGTTVQPFWTPALVLELGDPATKPTNTCV